jgi:flavin-dependent dehydrogenase
VTEVLVIGAGPAGAAAAIQFARAGRDVLLVDRCRFPRLKPCGEYYNPECCRLLGELEVLGRIEAAGAVRLPTLAMGTGEGCGLQCALDSVAPAGAFALSLGREVLDAILVEEARRAGAVVWEGTTFREPIVEDGAVVGACVERDGRHLEVRARLTLAADGLRSRFARKLGLGGGDGGRRKLGLAARYAASGGQPGRVEMHAGADGCCGIAVRGHEANLGMVVDAAHAGAIGGNPAAFFDAALVEYPALRRAVSGSPTSIRTVGPLTWRTRRKSSAGCLLLGDAAGFYDPFTGQGVTFALLTAELAFRVGDAALGEGALSAPRLREYDRLWRAVLAPRIALQRAIQAVLGRPALLRHVLGRLERHPEAARTLIGVISDVAAPSRVLTPAFLRGLVF